VRQIRDIEIIDIEATYTLVGSISYIKNVSFIDIIIRINIR